MKVCKLHNINYLKMIEGDFCPVCLKVKETKNKIAVHRKRILTILKSKRLEMNKIKEESKKIISALEARINEYESNPQIIYEDAKKENEVLK
jgi:ArsR family metal-binding transcriptional regulator